MISLELEVGYPDEAIAKAVMDSLEPDNGGYVQSELRGSKLVFRTEAQSAGTLRNTADDLMACLKIAEEAIGIATSAAVTEDPEE